MESIAQKFPFNRIFHCAKMDDFDWASFRDYVCHQPFMSQSNRISECYGAQLFFILLNSRKMTEKNAIDFSVALFYYVLLLLQTFSNVIFSQSCLQFLQISSLENVGFEISPFHSSRNSIPLRKKTGKTTVSLCCTKRKQMRENKMFSKDNFTNNYLMPIKKYFKVQIRIFFSSSIILLAFLI